MKILIAGPYVGEFGWELFCWQAYVRKQSRKFDKTVVIGRPTNEMLYADFCDEYIVFDPESFATDAYRCHGAKDPSELIQSLTSCFDQPPTLLSGNFDIGMHYHGHLIDTRGWFKNEQEFHQYSSDVREQPFDVLFHCRNKSTGAVRNWDLERWKILADILDPNLTVGCIGNHEAFHIEGTEDLRGIDLDELVSIMNNSKLIVGPSSGPMHLASLSGLKHLVWTDEFNRSRYEKDWNPFGTEVILHTKGGWNPIPSNIRDLIHKEI